jgi:hypothetical protein
MNNPIEALDHVKLNFSPEGLISLNITLALALMFNPKIFPSEMELGGMAIIAAWWGIWHIISGLAVSRYWSGRPVIVQL